MKMWSVAQKMFNLTNTVKNNVLFTSRSLRFSAARCTPMRPQAARPAASPLLGSTWAVTPPCWSVTCCWPTLGSTTVKSRLGESTTGARSTSLCWVSVFRHIVTHIHWLQMLTWKMHVDAEPVTNTDLITASLAWHISSVMLTDLMIQFDSDGVIWFRSCCLGSFGLVCW